MVSALLGAFAPAAHAAADGKAPRGLLSRTEAALHGRGDGRDVSALLKQVALALPHLEGADRARAYRLLARPTPGEGRGSEDEYRVPEHSPPHCTTHFCIHWVDSTSDAPDLTDANGNGVPDYVDTMAGVFEEVYAFENDRLCW